jgi:hypothetical protein
MTLCSVHAIWERFAEGRLAVALNHASTHFLHTHGVRGIARVPGGLASCLVRGGKKFFDFRSRSDLLGKADDLVSKASNPFRSISKGDWDTLDAMATIRNVISHGSEAAWDTYRNLLRDAFYLRSAPSPGEFLDSIDRRPGSPTNGRKRLYIFMTTARSVMASI